MDKRRLSFVYRLVVFASLALGIKLNFANTISAKFLLSYYTTQSNLLCCAIFFLFIIADIVKYNYRNKKWYHILKGGVTMAILLTFVIYLTTLIPNNLPMYSVSLNTNIISKKVGNFFVHGVSPILVLGDYTFEEKGKLKSYYPFLWLVPQVAYVIFVYSGKRLFYSIGGSRKYGYFFLDPEKVGDIGVIIWVLGIAIAILAMGYAWVQLDKKLAELEQKKNQKKKKKKNP